MFLLVFPVALLCVFMAIQYGVWAHAVDVAEAAAQQGARQARAHNASEADGRAAAVEVLDRLGRSIVLEREVTVSRDADVARVEVRGKAMAVVPGLSLPVRAVSEGAVERFRSEAEPPV